MYMGTFQSRLIRKRRSIVAWDVDFVTVLKLTDFDEIFYIPSYTKTSLEGYSQALSTRRQMFEKILIEDQ